MAGSGVLPGTRSWLLAVKLNTFLNSIVVVPEERNEQIKFAELLNEFQREIGIITKLNKSVEHQKRGLMQKLLTGEWRSSRTSNRM